MAWLGQVLEAVEMSISWGLSITTEPLCGLTDMAAEAAQMIEVAIDTQVFQDRQVFSSPQSAQGPCHQPAGIIMGESGVQQTLEQGSQPLSAGVASCHLHSPFSWAWLHCSVLCSLTRNSTALESQESLG